MKKFIVTCCLIIFSSISYGQTESKESNPETEVWFLADIKPRLRTYIQAAINRPPRDGGEYFNSSMEEMTTIEFNVNVEGRLTNMDFITKDDTKTAEMLKKIMPKIGMLETARNRYQTPIESRMQVDIAIDKERRVTITIRQVPLKTIKKTNQIEVVTITNKFNEKGTCIYGDCLKGFGASKYSDGEVYIGEWSGGNWLGAGAFIDSVNIATIGYWMFGELQLDAFINFNKNPFNKFDKEGNPDGLWVNFFTSGQTAKQNLYHIKNIGVYNHGIKDGKWLYFNENHPTKQEYYKNGKQDGTWIEYSAGIIHTIENYKNDIPDGLFIEYEQEYKFNKLEQVLYVNGKKEGEEIRYFKYREAGFREGIISVKGNYVNGLKDGEFINYDKDGQIFSKEIYKNGAFIKGYNLNSNPAQ